MTKHIPRTVSLGELIAAAYDDAVRYSADPQEISRIATHAVTRMLERARVRTSPSRFTHNADRTVKGIEF